MLSSWIWLVKLLKFLEAKSIEHIFLVSIIYRALKVLCSYIIWMFLTLTLKAESKWTQGSWLCQDCLKPSRTLWGSWAQKAFLCPLFLVGSRLQPPWSFFKGQIWTVANPGMKGVQSQGRSSEETIVQPWSRVLTPSQGKHITMSLSSLYN